MTSSKDKPPPGEHTNPAGIEYVPLNIKDVKTFDDIPDDQIVDIDCMSMGDLVGESIIIMGFGTRSSDFGKGEYFIVEAEYNEEKVMINTGSGAVCRQIEAYKPFFPLRVRVCQSGRKYYLEKA